MNTYRLEDAASFLFGTGEPSSDDLSETFQLGRALCLADCDSWTVGTLRQAHVLKSLAEDEETFSEQTLGSYVETAREFGYQWPSGSALVVIRLGRTVTRASVAPMCEIVKLALLQASGISSGIARVDFSRVSPLLRRVRPRFSIIRPSAEIEFLAQVAAA